MRFGVLGATEVLADDGTPLALGGPRVRALLVLLLLDAGRVVSAERLIDGMYGESPPDGAANALQSQISRLRLVLKGTAAVDFTSAGYRLDVAPDDVDAHRFTRLAAEGRAALAARESASAASLLREALSLWRGPAFADLADAPFVEPQSARLRELRASALEDRIEADLARGQHSELVAELQELVAADPLRERPRAQLMRALHASGRQADALAVYENAKHALAEELGADPGAELVEAHLAVLRGEAPSAAERVLPAQITSFVGRADDLERVGRLLSRGRLVTLTGPGGTGKTRLAIEAAGRETGSVAFVELAPHDNGADLPQAVLATLGLRETPRTAGPPQEPTERLITALQERSALLVLDNCEHVVDAAARLAARLLAGCPGVRLLVTSREPLGITGELLAPVHRLDVPPADTPAAEALAYPAVRLFADRASAGSADFAVDSSTVDDVQRICAALDGLPLAIELAAARVRSLSVGEIAARLDDRFTLLSRGSRTADTRHRTLRGVVEWSWDLLDEEERELARRLTVFAGGATLRAAEWVCGLPDTVELITSLVDKSLVEVSDDRYRMLQTIRAFCAEQLAEAGETERRRASHAEYFLELVRTADPHLRTADQLAWLALIDADYDNTLAALRWATTADTATALQLVSALSMYWWMRGRRFEGAQLSLELVKAAGTEPPEGLVEEYLLCLLSAMAGMPDHDLLRPHFAKVEAFTRARPWIPRQPIVHLLLGVVLGPPAEGSLSAAWEAAVRASEDPWVQALMELGAGLRSLLTGELAEVEAGLTRALVRSRASGERWMTATALEQLAALVGWRGDPVRALALMDEAFDLMRQLGSTDDAADLLSRRGELRARFGDSVGARADYDLAIELARRAGMPESRAAGLLGLADLARLEGDLATARRLAEQAYAECPEGAFSAADVRARTLITLGRLAEAEGDVSAATERLDQALALASIHVNNTVVALAVEAQAGVALLEGAPDRAATLLGAAESLRGSTIAGDPDVARVSAAARASAGPEAFDRAYAAGRGLTRTKALLLAGAGTA
jgi:predicted ATPase/DNA-binding SARP family transcriptional activator